jgi:hypothetical protein
MQNTLQTTGTSMTLNLEEAMRIKITRKNIPDYTIPLLSAWLSEGTHGIAYTGDVSAYLTQVAEKYDLPLPKFDEIDTELVEAMNDAKSLGILLAFIQAKENTQILFNAVIKFNAIQARNHFTSNATPIKQVACEDYHNTVTAILCATNGYQVTLYHHGYESYYKPFSWVLTLLFPQISVKKMDGSYERKSDSLDVTITDEFDYASSAFIGFDDYVLEGSSRTKFIQSIKQKFAYVITDGAVKTYPSYPAERINFSITDNKQSYIRGAWLATSGFSQEITQIMAFDFENPSNDVFMSNLVNYENTAGQMASFTELLADEDYTTKVSTSEIIANKYNFSVSYYAKDTRAKTWLKSLKQFDVVDLSDVVTFHRPPTIKTLKDEAESEVFYEIALSDINEFSRIDYPKKEVLVNQSDALRTKNEGLEKGDVLFAIKGDIGRVALVQTVDNRLMGKAFIGLRLKPKYLLQGMTPEYLVAYLADDNVKNYIRHLNTGAKVENIRMDDLKSIPVIIDKQFIKKTQFTIDALETKRKEIKFRQIDYRALKKELSHSIAGSGEYLNEMPMSMEKSLNLLELMGK